MGIDAEQMAGGDDQLNARDVLSIERTLKLLQVEVAIQDFVAG